jgi:hypothetical protein
MDYNEDWVLEKFGKHVPRILRNQLISNLIEYCVSSSDKVEPDYSITHCLPSIERFHGALLFIDISGFTALSQRLNVDDLRSHINAYFKKMLDIIDKYDGEVIKFAGDAMFIIWQTKIHKVDNKSI